MDNNILPRDQNHVPAAGFESSTTPGLVLPGRINEITGRILVNATSSAGTGDVVGPASATNDNIPVYDGPTGKIIKNSTKKLTDLAPIDSVATSVRVLTTQKGGVIRAIDSATGNIARTTSGFIEDERFASYFRIDDGTLTGEFDSAITRTGRLSAYLLTTNASGRGRFLFGINVGTGPTLSAASLSKFGLPLKPSTSYRLSAWIRYANIAGSGALLSVHQHSVDGTRVVQVNDIALSGTSDWVKREMTFTTNDAALYGIITAGPGLVGDAQEFRIDINSMTLEEVTTVTNPDITPALLIPTFTAVTSVDNIDQSQLTFGRDDSIGFTNTVFRAQQFLPTKKYLTSIVFKSSTAVGTFTGTVTVSIRTNSSNAPTATILASQTYTNAAWLALTGDVTVNLPCILTAGATHWIVFQSSTADAANFARIRAVTGNAYTSGLYAYSADGVTWTNEGNDLYFITNYAKKSENFTVATDTESLQLTSDQDGILSGAVIDLEAGTYVYSTPFKSNVNDPINDGAGNADVFASGGNLIPNYTIGRPQTNRSYVLNSFGIVPTSTQGRVIIKVNFTRVAKSIVGTFYTGRAGVRYSYDNVTWVELLAFDGLHNVFRTATIPTNGGSVIFIELFGANSSQSYANIDALTATLDTTPLTFPTLAPGANNVYLASSSTAASTDQDPSLEMSAQLDAKTLSLIDVFRELNEVSQIAALNSLKNSYPSADATKVGHITVTQAVNLDTMESDIATNNTKVSFDATSSTRLANTSGTNTGDQTTVSGNAGSATVLQTARTIAGVSFNGSANITIAATNLSDSALLARLASPTFTGTVSGITATMVGLGNVNNTSNATERAAVATLTNKRISRRVLVVTQAAAPSMNTDNADIAQITALAQAITNMTTNLTGTPVAGDYLMVQITDNGTARAITWSTGFASTTVALPTTTVISTMLRVGFQRNNANTVWDCIAVA